MSEQSQRYARAKWIVQSNAKVQALGDSNNYPRERIIDTLTDPQTYVYFEAAMKGWRYGPKAQLVFRQMNEKDYTLLTMEEKQELIQLWIDDYYQEVIILLRKRLERESKNADS